MKPSISYCEHIDYLGVDYELVWDIVQSKIPDLRRAMVEIIAKEKHEFS